MQRLHADLQELTVLFEVEPGDKPSKTMPYREYVLDVSNDGTFWARAFMTLNHKNTHDMWLLADEIRSIVAARSQEDDAEFDKIVTANAVHKILASLDDPKRPSNP